MVLAVVPVDVPVLSKMKIEHFLLTNVHDVELGLVVLNEVSQLKDKQEDMDSKLETMKKESFKLVQTEEKTQNVQIEELVREIEYCINQLKK